MAKKDNEECGMCCSPGSSKLVSFGIVFMVMLAGILVGIAVFPKDGPAGSITLTTPTEHTISVNGEAQQTLSPDQLVLSLSVETQEDSAALSQSKNADLIDKVKKALLAKGVLERDISTDSYYVYPVEQSHWICPDNMADCKDDEKIYDTKITGYKTTHSLSVKTVDLNNGGILVDAAVQAGATNVNSVSFTLKDETRRAIEENLLKYASANAKVKAQKIADGLTVKLGAPTSAGNSYVYFPGPVYREYNMAMDSAPSTSFSPGEMVVTASVSVSYLME